MYDNPADALAYAERAGIRIRVHYGDTNTGRDWGDVNDVRGTVGRSIGPTRVPLLIANTRSSGGFAMSTDSIVRLRHANRRDGGDLYRHPNYQPPTSREDYPNGGEACTVQEWDREFAPEPGR